MDLVVSNTLYGNIAILFDYGNGTFETYKTLSILNDIYGNRSSSIVIRDFNGDGNLDIVVAYNFEINVALFLGYGNGTFKTPIWFPSGIVSIIKNVFSIAVGDVNDDGRLDFIFVAEFGTNFSIVLNTC